MKVWQRLKQKWGIESDWQMLVIFTVFALTGSASVWLAKPVLSMLHLDTLHPAIRIPLRLVLIFPVYQVVLITLGTVFGQRRFFWNFILRMWRIRRKA